MTISRDVGVPEGSHEDIEERGDSTIHHSSCCSRKSFLLESITNITHGNDTDHHYFDILDHTSKQNRSNNQNQTNSAQIYELTSNNGIVV